MSTARGSLRLYLGLPRHQALARIGTARPSDFDEHMKSIGKYDQRAELVPPIEAKLNAMYEEAMGKDWVAGWWKGLPDPFGNVDGKPVDGSLVNVPANPHVVIRTKIPGI